MRRAFAFLRAAAPALVALTVFCAGSPAADAQELRIVNRVEGGETSKTLSLAELDALEQGEIATETAWTTGRQRFAGVPGAGLAELFPAGASRVTAIALDDYVVVIPISDFVENRLLLATRRNGKLMRIRDNGPFWIVYDYDSLSTSLRIAAETRSVWQLKTLIVE